MIRCELYIGDEMVALITPDNYRELITELESKGKNNFHIHSSASEFLNIVLARTRGVVLYTKHGDSYTCLDASMSPTHSSARVVLLVGAEMTPFPENMVLPRALVFEIILLFCISGELFQSVFWLRDGG